MNRNIATKMSCLVLAMMLVLAIVLSGCGSTTDTAASAVSSSPAQSEATMAETTPAAEPTATPLAPVSLKWYVCAAPPNDPAPVMTEANKIIGEKLNATLDMVFIDGANYSDKMNLVISAGEDWDLCFTASWTNNYIQNAAKGAYLALDDLLPLYAKDILNYEQLVVKETWDAIRVNGKIYGVKYDSPIPFASGFEGPKEIFDKVGFDIKTVKKLSDLEPFLAKVKAEMPDVTPFLSNGYTGVSKLPYFMDAGNDGKYEIYTSSLVLDTTDNKFKAIYDVPEYLESTKVLRDFYNKGYLAKDAATIQEADHKKYGVWPSHAVMEKTNTTNGEGAFGFPCVEVKTVSAVTKTSDCLGVITAINANSKNPERALMLANLVASDLTLFNLLGNGIKDKNYKVIGEAPDRPIIEPIPDSGYAPGMSWEIGSYTMNYTYAKYTYDDIKDEVRMRKAAKVSPFMGFLYAPTEDVKNEAAAVDAVFGKYQMILETGSADPVETMAKCKDELIKAGMEKVVVAAQKQFDDWSSTQK